MDFEDPSSPLIASVQERRRSDRVPVDWSVIVDGALILRCFDVSLHGVAVDTGGLDVGAQINLQFPFEGGITARAEGTVQWSNEHTGKSGMALTFMSKELVVQVVDRLVAYAETNV